MSRPEEIYDIEIGDAEALIDLARRLGEEGKMTPEIAEAIIMRGGDNSDVVAEAFTRRRTE